MRIPMSTGTYEFEILENNGIEVKKEKINIKIDKLISKGATSLVYEGGAGNRSYVIKEFYPCIDNISRDDVDGKLILSNQLIQEMENQDSDNQIAIRFRQFKKSYENQNLFSSEEYRDTLNQIIVKPTYLAKRSNTYYIISEYESAISLEEIKRFSIIEMLNLWKEISCVMKLLLENGFMLLDICEENFLYTRPAENNISIRLFDLDSIIKIDECGFIKKEDDMDLFFHEDYMPKEILECYNNCTPYIDASLTIYSLGILFKRLLNEEISEDDLLKKSIKNMANNYIWTSDVDKLVNLLNTMTTDKAIKRNQKGYLGPIGGIEKIIGRKEENIDGEIDKIRKSIAYHRKVETNKIISTMLKFNPIKNYISNENDEKIVIVGDRSEIGGDVCAFFENELNRYGRKIKVILVNDLEHIKGVNDARYFVVVKDDINIVNSIIENSGERIFIGHFCEEEGIIYKDTVDTYKLYIGEDEKIMPVEEKEESYNNTTNRNIKSILGSYFINKKSNLFVTTKAEINKENWYVMMLDVKELTILNYAGTSMFSSIEVNKNYSYEDRFREYFEKNLRNIKCNIIFTNPNSWADNEASRYKIRVPKPNQEESLRDNFVLSCEENIGNDVDDFNQFIIRHNFNKICQLKLKNNLNKLHIYVTDVALPYALMRSKYNENGSSYNNIKVDIYGVNLEDDGDRPSFVLLENNMETDRLYKIFDNSLNNFLNGEGPAKAIEFSGHPDTSFLFDSGLVSENYDSRFNGSLESFIDSDILKDTHTPLLIDMEVCETKNERSIRDDVIRLCRQLKKYSSLKYVVQSSNPQVVKYIKEYDVRIPCGMVIKDGSINNEEVIRNRYFDAIPDFIVYEKGSEPSNACRLLQVEYGLKSLQLEVNNENDGNIQVWGISD